MPINEKFLAARFSEQRFRLMVHVRALCWVRLLDGKGVFAHTPLVPLTERHRIELGLAGCAFFRGGIPTDADLRLFLWRLHPHYRAPILGRERWAARRLPGFLQVVAFAYALGSLRSARTFAGITAMLRRCDIDRTTAAVERFIAQADQDAPSEDADPARPRVYAPAAPQRCGPDNLIDYVLRNYGLTPDQALDMPVALFNQLYRDRQLQQEDGELAVFAPSDALLNA